VILTFNTANQSLLQHSKPIYLLNTMAYDNLPSNVWFGFKFDNKDLTVTLTLKTATPTTIPSFVAKLSGSEESPGQSLNAMVGG